MRTSVELWFPKMLVRRTAADSPKSMRKGQGLGMGNADLDHRCYLALADCGRDDQPCPLTHT